jgi:hypothetical protein
MTRRAILFFGSVWVSAMTSFFANAENTSNISKISIPDLPPSFRDVSIELRCDALSAFVNVFASDNLSDLGYKELGCSEGNGIGGANYVLEFKFRDVADVKAYSLQIDIDGKNVPKTKLCMQSTNETICSQTFTQIPISEVSHFAASNDTNLALVNRNYLQPTKKLTSLLPTVISWVSAEQRFVRIFGRDYDAYVNGKVKKPWELPVNIRDQASRLKVELTPSKASNSEGSIKLLDELPTELRSCLDCKDGFCTNLDLSYTFNNRFFAVSGKTRQGEASEMDIEKAKFGLAWVMDGPEPFEKSESNWRFFCGVSRYSVQVIKN